MSKVQRSIKKTICSDTEFYIFYDFFQIVEHFNQPSEQLFTLNIAIKGKVMKHDTHL